MKNSNGFPRRRQARTSLAVRSRLLAAFERSGLSAAAFARQQGIRYTTFCGWRHRRAKTKPSPAFVEIEVAEPDTAGELWIELGARPRLRLSSSKQVELAAHLLRRCNALGIC